MNDKVILEPKEVAITACALSPATMIKYQQPRRYRYLYRKGEIAKLATSTVVGIYMVHCCLIHGAEPNEKAIHLLKHSKKWRVRKKQLTRLKNHVHDLERGRAR